MKERDIQLLENTLKIINSLNEVYFINLELACLFAVKGSKLEVYFDKGSKVEISHMTDFSLNEFKKYFWIW